MQQFYVADAFPVIQLTMSKHLDNVKTLNKI